MNTTIKAIGVFFAVFIVMCLFEFAVYLSLEHKAAFLESVNSLIATNIVIALLWVLGYVTMKDMKN